MTAETDKPFHSWKPVDDCFKHEPLVKLLYAALTKHRCKFDPEKSIKAVGILEFMSNGGYYDMQTKEIKLNKSQRYLPREYVCRILQHEMIHFFDDCRAKLDPKNIDHIACSEIRAANLTNCREFKQRFGETHQDCVKKNALVSVEGVFEDKKKSQQAINKVFEKCYNDLEPLGRRIRYRTADPALTLWDNYYYGYTDSVQGDFERQNTSQTNS